MLYEYKVVRTWDDGKYTELLEKAFKEGYEFVRASEYVPSATYGGMRRYGYIEYILRRSDEANE
jgi:hypothetical protein